MRLIARYYQQFDADFDLDVPAEGYAGWQEASLDLDLDRVALVVMHAWDAGSRARFPGWYRAVEYLPRADAIARNVLPPLLAATRQSGVALFHVVGGGDYYKDYPGYRRALALAGPEPALPQIEADDSLRALQRFRAARVFVGAHNEPDVAAGFARLDFHPQARPVGDEGVAENATQLFALCRERGINHLIYAGFAINWCLLMSPGGMIDMSRRGFMCSVLRQAVTAVENRESARLQLHKEEALWRVALAFGFVFDVDEFIRAVVAQPGSEEAR